MKDRINHALSTHLNANVNKIQAVAAKQFRSGNIAAHTSNKQKKNSLQEHTDGWMGTLGDSAGSFRHTASSFVHLPNPFIKLH